MLIEVEAHVWGQANRMEVERRDEAGHSVARMEHGDVVLRKASSRPLYSQVCTLQVSLLWRR